MVAARTAVLLLTGVFAAHGICAADDVRQSPTSAEPADASTVEPVDDPLPAGTAEEEEQRRRQNTVAAGVLILLGVAAIGLLLIAGALIWGGKLRRMVREPVEPRTQEDDLWYLRHPDAAEADPEQQSSQREARDDDDRAATDPENDTAS